MSPEFPFQRRLGAFPLRGSRTEFRVWAPNADAIQLRTGGSDHALEPAGFGIYETILDAVAGDDYEFVVDGTLLPDPCSRWQPDGLRGPSRIVDAGGFDWTDGSFRVPSLHDAVIYELHVGWFSPEGTFEGAIPYLAELGRTGRDRDRADARGRVPGPAWLGLRRRLPGRRQSSYGGPRGLQRLVDASHAAAGRHPRRGLQPPRRLRREALMAFGPYFTHKHATPWATASTSTTSSPTPCASGSARAPRAGFATSTSTGSARRHPRDRRLEPRAPGGRDLPPRARGQSRRARDRRAGLNDPRVMRVPEIGGHGCDAAWADDFHHALRVLLTGEIEGWYGEFDSIELLAKAYRRPHVHDGTYSEFRRRRFGAPADDVPPERFVVFSANHDQVGNRALGDRLPVEARPLAAFCTLLSPFTPMRSRARSTASGRRSSSSPTTSTRRSPTRPARAAGASSPPSPSSRRRGARSAGRRDLRALEADPGRGAGRPARAARRAAARPPRAARRCRRHRLRRARRLARGPPRRVHAAGQLWARFGARAARAHRGGPARHARADARARLRRPAPLAGALVR